MLAVRVKPDEKCTSGCDKPSLPAWYRATDDKIKKAATHVK